MDATPIGAVLAGGAGARMGRPKAGVELAGLPLIRYPLDAIDAAGLEPVVVAKADSILPPLDCRVLTEPSEPRHPLAGVVAALREGRPTVVLACDLPFVPAALVRHLAEGASGAAVVEAGGRLHPLLARYDPDALETLHAALERGRPVAAAARALDPQILGEDELRGFGDPARICFNVNSPADLERAEEMLLGPVDARS